MHAVDVEYSLLVYLCLVHPPSQVRDTYNILFFYFLLTPNKLAIS